ncbi:NlpC/P60 family protein [Armatimonas sp.]|uniref:NlpC/P60 family protein n=1 Tax=Armatimonas sp. TaxID=1872638 RepID=UPI00286BFE0A|nr:NlpC/P60 family protein [Armatimonas sp.]
MATRRQRRRIKLMVWAVVVLLAVVLALLPVSSGGTRKLLVASIFLAWGGGLLLFWGSIVGRIAFLLPLAGAIGLAMMPYRAPKPERLQTVYTESLKRYEGVRYVWGGESKWGIDCSGLIRCGMIDACISEGWQTKDLSLLRTAAALWWYDASALEMGRGYNGRTYVFKENQQLNTTDYTKLHPGDLAVTESRQHILAYLGDKTWINADPKGQFAVVSKTAPQEKDAWFSTPVKLVRWYRLQ